MLVFDKNVYRDKAYGGWLGKNIGGTLGGPYEGAKELLDLKFYPEPPDGKPLPNDDLDLQLVWLHALEQYGPHLTAVHLGREWVDHVRFAFDEYGYGLYNLRRGILPPVSGWFSNPFVDCMGAPIRSEIWAMIVPGLPELAAYYAWNDAVVDHGNGESVWGEVLFAAIESAAFVESDPRTLIDIGMRLIPKESRVARAVRLLLELHAEGVPWQQAREAILKEYGHDNFTDAPQNIAFTLLGWLYGEDFEDALLKATNCGYDTDCTAATLGAILGIVHGAGALWNVERMPIAMVPKLEWEISAPDGQTYRVSASTTEIPFTACGAGNEPGWWRAKTTIQAAVDQEARLIVATVVPMRARLRGEKVLEAVEPRIFMPAYHRAVPSTRQEVSLRRGANELEVEVHFEKDVQPVIVAVVDPTRGRHHAALDVTFELG